MLCLCLGLQLLKTVCTQVSNTEQLITILIDITIDYNKFENTHTYKLLISL